MNITIFGRNEITDSVDGTLENRMHTPLYGTFILSWVFFHWQLIYTAFFVDQGFIYSKHHMLRNEYLRVEFFNYRAWLFWVWWVAPFILTWLIIWVFPRFIALPAFRKEEESKNKKKAIALQEAAKIEEAETKLVKRNAQKLEATEETVKKRRDIARIDPTTLWSEEYEKFRKSGLFNAFQGIVDSIYDHRGQVKDNYDGFSEEYGFEIPQGMLVYADTNGLVNLTNAATPRISLTDKGKYFVSRFASDKSN